MLTKNGNDKSTFSKVDQAKAAWALKVYQESGRNQTTSRAMHYFCLNRTDYPLFKPVDVRPYKDSDADHVTEWIALAKRLGLIPWNAIRDETVCESGVLEFIPHRSDYSYSYSNSFNYYSLSDLTKHLNQTHFERSRDRIERDQPYHLELWVEKNTMNAMLEPVCDRHDTVLVTFKGQCSWGSVWNLCERANQDPRPTIVFYLSDLDCYGFLMAAQMAEKVDEINRSSFDGRLDIRVRRIGLTPDQVKQYSIPRVQCPEPKKKKNGDSVAIANRDRFDAYVKPFGFDHTKKAELDSLERYYPGGVAAFAVSWLEKFYDTSLSARCLEATIDLDKGLAEAPELPAEIVSLRSKLLMGLEELIEKEEKIKVPDGGSEKPDIEPITENPAQESWLLSTKDGVYPRTGDVDFVVATQEMV